MDKEDYANESLSIEDFKKLLEKVRENPSEKFKELRQRAREGDLEAELEKRGIEV